jgi:hypothetical protein
LVLVPDSLPGRFAFLDEMFAGTAVDVLRDRRRRDRRDRPGVVTEERRRGDRRRPAHPVGYVFGCAILALEAPPAPSVGPAIAERPGRPAPASMEPVASRGRTASPSATGPAVAVTSPPR